MRTAALTLCLACAGCSDYFGDGPDPGAAGTSEGKRAVSIQSGIAVEAMVVDEDGLYVKNGQGVLSVQKSGNQDYTILASSGPNVRIATDSDFVYFVEDAGAVKAVPKAGGEILNIAPDLSGSSGANAILVDDENVYFGVGPSLGRVSKTGGTSSVIATDLQGFGPQQGMTFSDNDASVFYVGMVQNDGKQYALRAVDKASLAVTTLTTRNQAIAAISADSSAVYFLEVSQDYRPPLGLERFDLETLELEEIASLTASGSATAGGTGLGLVGDDAALYFSSFDNIMVWTKDAASPPKVVTASQPSAFIGIDEEWIFWVTQNGGGIWGIRR